MRLGIVDTDSGLVRVLIKRAEVLGWQHSVFASPVPTDTLVAMRFDAVVMDIAVLGPSGWGYLDQVCGEIPHLGVVVCSGPSSVAQRVRALRLGADDWVPKPCHPEELVARVEAVVRRRRRIGDGAGAEALVVGEIELLPGQFQVTVAGTPLELTRREFELLQLLVRGEGRVLEREDIYERVWGYAMVHGDRSIDVYVRKLRQKLERASPGWRYIHTHFGIGYRLAPESDAEPPPLEDDLAVELNPVTVGS
jgi:DNA-binding response OmpR family regulator